jgi:hypothetical protein
MARGTDALLPSFMRPPIESGLRLGQAGRQVSCPASSACPRHGRFGFVQLLVGSELNELAARFVPRSVSGRGVEGEACRGAWSSRGSARGHSQGRLKMGRMPHDRRPPPSLGSNRAKGFGCRKYPEIAPGRGSETAGSRAVEQADRDTLGDFAEDSRNHVEHIYSKIGASNRAEASLYAVQHGLLAEEGMVASSR